MLSEQVKINSLMNQISRADRRTSKLIYLIEALRTDITNRLRNGYKKEAVASCVLRYQAYQKSKGPLPVVLCCVRNLLDEVLNSFP